MVLLRIIILKALTNNVKIKVKHISGTLNLSADFLSRMRYDKFRKLAKESGKKFNNMPDTIPEEIFPMEKIWIKEETKSKNKNSK